MPTASPRRRMMAANWKMHKTAAEATAFFGRFRELCPSSSACAVVVAPPFTSIPAAVAAARGADIAIAGQDLHWEVEGAFTGEVSGGMLTAAGCAYVIVGHSERRQYFGDTDATVRRKVRAALAATLSPIVCVGETAEQRAAGQVEAILRAQVGSALDGLAPEEACRCVLAYEPIWAIGTGNRATPETAEATHAFLRHCVAERFGGPLADGLTILYGGSMKPGVEDDLLAQPNVDGGLVGGASLDPDAFAALLRGCAARGARD